MVPFAMLQQHSHELHHSILYQLQLPNSMNLKCATGNDTRTLKLLLSTIPLILRSSKGLSIWAQKSSSWCLKCKWKLNCPWKVDWKQGCEGKISLTHLHHGQGIVIRRILYLYNMLKNQKSSPLKTSYLHFTHWLMLWFPLHFAVEKT